jgi:CHAD domain-containing protein
METPRLAQTNPASARRVSSGTRELQAPAGLCLAEALEARWQSYCQQFRSCREDFSEEGIHKLRVATRRLIAHLVLLGDVMRSAELEKARRILKRRMVALGKLRDTHVQRALIASQATRFPELGLLRAWLERRERRLARSAARQVAGCKTRKLGKWVRALARELSAKSRGARAQSRLASTVLRTTAAAFAQAVERRQAIALADLRTIHQTRVAFKRFRYMVEALSPDLTGLSKRQLRALAYYQRKMGLIQDLEVMRACVARFIQEDAEAEAPLGRFAHYLQRRRARALRIFLQSADRLFDFWPPTGLTAAGERAGL